MTSLRRRCALAVAAIAVAAPLLSSCGFDYATDRPNTIIDGGSHLDGPIHVLAARIVAPAQGTGTFIATISVEPTATTASLTQLSGEGLTAASFSPVEVEPGGRANLAVDGGIAVTGSFGAGDSVPVTLGFDNGDSIEVSAVVVKQCHEYADVKPQTPDGDASAEPSAPASPYDCEYVKAPPITEEH